MTFARSTTTGRFETAISPLIGHAVESIRLPAADDAAAVDYKQFTIKAFEQSRGKWRARVWRTGVKPPSARRKPEPFVTAEDSASAADAVRAAMEAIDAGVLPRRPTPERYWRPKRGTPPFRRPRVISCDEA